MNTNEDQDKDNDSPEVCTAKCDGCKKVREGVMYYAQAATGVFMSVLFKCNECLEDAAKVSLDCDLEDVEPF